MRAAVIAVLLLLLLTVAPRAQAPGDGIQHGSLFSWVLAPTEQISRRLDFADGLLLGGWVFLLAAKVQSGTLDLRLTVDTTVAGTWSVPATPRWVQTTILPQDGTYFLSMSNAGPSSVDFTLYFDQSCNCAGKSIPADIPNALIIFNRDTPGSSTVFAQFNEPRAMRVRVTAALLANARGQWPADFVTLAESTSPVPRQVRPDLPPVLLHELRFPVADPVRVYFFLEGIAYSPSNNTGPTDLFITPFYEVTGQGISPFLLVGVGAAFACLGGLLLWRGRIRERPAKARGKGPKARGKKVTPRGDAHGGRRTRTSRGSRRRT